MNRIPTPTISPRASFLYLISEPYGAFKIGIALDVQKRLETLQCATPYTLTIVRKVKITNALQAEQAIHGLLAKYHIRGEWFQLPSADIFDAALTQYKQVRSQKLPPKPPTFPQYSAEIQAELLSRAQSRSDC